jgi:hypothetical protein
MRQKFVVRLLDADDALLAWTTVWAGATPLGGGRSCQFWPESPTQFATERDGVAVKLSVHWVDYDVARWTTVPATPIQTGQVFTFTWIEPVWLVPGMADVPLPGVTVRQSVAVAVPTGAVSAMVR